jgi:hypothetical protein
MKKLLLIVSALTICVPAVMAQTPQMPTPGSEQKALERWVGTWKMEGTAKDTPLGPGGKITGSETCRMFEGGWHLVCDIEGTGPWGPMKSHSILTWDRAKKTYQYFAVNNMPDAETATGIYDGKTWTWSGTVDMEGKTLHSRYVMTETSPTTDAMRWEISTDGGRSWTTAMESTATKVSK